MHRILVFCCIVTTVAAASCSGPELDDRALSRVDDEPRPVWKDEAPAGMYGWDPEGGFHNRKWSGTLVVEHPCVYLDIHDMQDYRQEDEGLRGDAPAASTELPPLRSYVRLPEPLTRYDESTGRLWVGGYGPMSTGDEIVLIGSEGWQQEWHQDNEDTIDFERVWPVPMGPPTPVCIANVSFWAASMSPDGASLASVPNTAEMAGLGLFPSDPEELEPLPGPEGGRLIIDPPCVYFVREVSNAEDWETSRIEPARYFMHLKRPLVRFEAESGTLWYENWPFATGEKIMAVGWDRPAVEHTDAFLDAGCSAEGANGNRHSFVTFMAPCDDPPANLNCGD